MLRNPRSFYETKRGWAALKMKSYLECDAVVKKNHQSQWLEVEIGDKHLKVTKLSQNVEEVKPGQKVQLRYAKVAQETGLPYKPTATRVLVGL